VDVLHQPEGRHRAGERVEPFQPRGEQAVALRGLGRRGSRRCDDRVERVQNNARTGIAGTRRPQPLGPVLEPGRAHELADGLERGQQVRAELRAKDSCARACGGGRQLREQAALPHPRRRDHEHESRRTDAAEQTRELDAAADHRRAEVSERRLARRLLAKTRDAPRPDRLRLPLQLERTDRLELDRRSDRERRHLPDDDASGVGRRLETGGNVDRVAGDRPTFRGRLAVHRLAARDADAEAQGARVEPELRADALDRRDEGEPRADRALGVVVARRRSSEHRHRCVADELLQQPAVPVDRLPNRLEVRVLDDGHVLGVEPLGQGREADEVGEEDGDDAALDRAACHRASLLRDRRTF
jgi:hypothetical protein